MESKEQLRSVVNMVSNRTGLSQEKMAMELGYGANYISEMLSPSGKITSKFIRAFRNHFKEHLENPKSGKVVSEIGVEKTMEIMDERIKELKEDKEWLKKMFESNLTGLIAGQASILYHIQAALEQGDDLVSGGDKKKAARLRESRGRRISELLTGTEQKGNTIDGTFGKRS